MCMEVLMHIWYGKETIHQIFIRFPLLLFDGMGIISLHTNVILGVSRLFMDHVYYI